MIAGCRILVNFRGKGDSRNLCAECNLVSIDLVKSIFQISGFDEDRIILFNKKVKRSNLIYELSPVSRFFFDNIKTSNKKWPSTGHLV